MTLKAIVISVLLATGLACCHSKSSRQLPFKDAQEIDAQLQHYDSTKNFDSIFTLGSRWINRQAEGNRYDSAMRIAYKLYMMLQPAPELQKKLALDVYAYRDLIEKDTTALPLYYKLFTYEYAYWQFNKTYDPEYVSIANHFILLARKFSFLDSTLLLQFYQNLGIVYNIAGDLKKASYYNNNIYAMDRQRLQEREGKQGWDTALQYFCSSTINYSIALNDQRQFDSSISIVNMALSKKEIDDYYRSGLCNSMADALLGKGEPEQAMGFINQAEHAALQLNDPDTAAVRLSDIYTAKSSILTSLQQPAGALTASKNAMRYRLARGSFHDRSLGKNLLQTGNCFKQLGQTDSATWYFHLALYSVAPVDSANLFSLPEEKNIYAENTMMDALDSLALTWDEQYTKTKNKGYLEKALQARKLAFIVETKLLEAFTYDESMKSQLLQDKKRSEYALNNCYRLWQQDQNPKWIAQALLMNEQSKAVALLHSLKKNSALNSLQQQDSTAILLNRNRLQTITLEKELNNTTGSEEKTALQNRLNELYREGLLLENELKARLPGFKRTGVDTSSLSLEAIRKNLVNQQSCLLQYFAAGTGAYLVWVDGAGTQGMQWIPGSSLPAVDSFITVCRQPHGLYENDRQAFFSLAKLVTHTVLPETIQQHIKNGNYKKLLVIPDGNFSLLPFDALTPSDEQFLVRYATVYTGYSISTLLANDTPKEQAKDISVFIPFNRSNIGELTRLEFSQEEANAVLAARKTARVYADTAAGINRFRHVLGTSRIIHLATHAMGSSTRQVIFFNDDALDVSELYALHTHAELVVLNGCETGAGLIDPNEGPMSLARGFYYAGARNVINSLWQIDDLATASMFGNFYKDYATGKTGPALRNAKLGYLDTHSGKELAPYYWAGLVQTGMDMEPVKNKQWKRWLPAGFILIALLIFGLAAYKRRRH